MMEAVRTIEMPVYLRETTRRYIPESHHLHISVSCFCLQFVSNISMVVTFLPEIRFKFIHSTSPMPCSRLICFQYNSLRFLDALLLTPMLHAGGQLRISTVCCQIRRSGARIHMLMIRLTY
jgi:hypothetical protein